MLTKHEYLEENEFATVIDTDVTFAGSIETQEPNLIKGSIIDSKIKASLLVIVDGGKISGDIESDIISVIGECSGNIRVHDTLRLLKGGKLLGKVNTKTIIVGEGGIFNGECTMKE